ncbi:MAG: LysM peptidoglycan-binding domain-containing protein [Chitinophagaceae bacterium]|nr:LysM peptidoglycan-binding domain-containing protein [Chitinophagaceae bacterium]MBN8668374.1 LysM peptidoglycan-binding domain-containing protein [Chitinophagales bacterium]
MKKMIFLGLFLAVNMLVIAQDNRLVVKKGSNGLYLEHSVAAKEGLYSIGRLYNVHPRHLASYNNWDMSKGLAIGQLIQVPLTDTNFNLQAQRGTPVYYVTGQGEGLFRVSQLSKKLTAEKLRQWNGLKSDNIAAGQYLVIGYLISDEWAKNKPEVVANKPETKDPVKPAEPEIVQEKPVVETQKPVVSEQVKVDPKPVQPTPQRTGAEGYFKAFFDQQIKLQPVSKQQTVNASIFKTLSGWQDGKFYLLMDNVLPGTIVKLSNPENGKVVYAKVLGEMAGIKLNQGLDIRISNAASSVLEIPEANTEKFIVQIEW